MKRYADLATDDRGTDPVNDDYSWRKDPDGGILKFSEAAWRGFVADVRAGRYDSSIG